MKYLMIVLLIIGTIGYYATQKDGIDVDKISQAFGKSIAYCKELPSNVVAFITKKKSKKTEPMPLPDMMSPLAPPATTFFLKNGSTLQAAIVEETNDRYVVSMGGGTIILLKSEIKEVVSGEATQQQAKQCTFYLKNGTAVSALLTYDDGTLYTVEYQGNTIGIAHTEVERIEDGVTLNDQDGIHIPDKTLPSWNYQNPVVVVLINGQILDQEIAAVTKTMVTLRTSIEGGGSIEQDIEKERIDHLLFKPVENEETSIVHANAAKLFPQMKRYDEGNITIFTDSYITWVRHYKTAVLRTQSDIYLHFYPLFKGAQQRVQHTLVIFDDPEQYIEYAVLDGVPGWIAPGYFAMEDHVLYLFNMAGDRMIEHVDACMRQGLGKFVDTQANAIKSQIDERYHVFVEGEAQGIKNKYWRYLEWYKAQFRDITFMVLRHEFTHEMFSNFGLVSVLVSTMNPKDREIIDKKKTFLEGDNIESKKRILQDLATLRSSDIQPEIKASNSWLAEGLATYCETEAVGEDNTERIYGLQEAKRSGDFLPLEQLTVYKLGSFPGVYHEAMLAAYAQSWVLVRFLMERYPDQFMSYITRIALQEPKDDEDLAWLIEAVGKEARVLEQEIEGFVRQFPAVDDPMLKEIETLDKLRDDLMTMGDV